MRRVVSVLATVMILLGLSSAPAPAKGPTHVMMLAVSATGAGAHQFLELSDSRAQEVERLLGDLGERYRGREFEKWQEVQVSWTVHAFEIFRSDIVFVDGKGAAVVMTLRNEFQQGTSTDWRRVRDGEALTEAFAELGLLGSSAPAASSPDSDSDSDSSAAGASGTASSTSSSSGPVVETSDPADESGTSGWRWALPALLVGLLLGAAGSGALRRRTGQVVAQRLASS